MHLVRCARMANYFFLTLAFCVWTVPQDGLVIGDSGMQLSQVPSEGPRLDGQALRTG
jgi:hypothetical protein